MKLGETYTNGQPVTAQSGDILTYYFEDGTVKAQGPYIDGHMEGKWIFNKKEGYLWQEGHFLHDEKHGIWKRYNADGSIQHEETFEHNQKVKK